jgi:hypothetical protein
MGVRWWGECSGIGGQLDYARQQVHLCIFFVFTPLHFICLMKCQCGQVIGGQMIELKITPTNM